ncbi:DUF3854 domain-containing protein [Mycobacterium avium]|uniref:DUF3854 domain-containing protein n=1 Tax=Mycobacterium avium TaxID=1764 RepID=UPI001CC3505D|nr:DUF3854 domain-containing protein [Mycobacterium avium]MBZ4580996.1 DUF3854 domain-containing protein [Mycobacterium avium subsp. hominissuis]MBZ4608919.1 DUF3854 domain-containing protein [Mycobacterium avium subsp. hominissuis]
MTTTSVGPPEDVEGPASQEGKPGTHHTGRTTDTAEHISIEHLEMLAKSGITPEHAAARGYETVTDASRLAEIKIVQAARSHVPGLLVPMLAVDGSTWGYQYRPDTPRLRDGKPIKYETPWQQRNGLDIPPGVAPMLGDPSVPLWITEGVKKADCGALHGLCIVGLTGVWNWMTTNTAGGKVALPDWRDCGLNGRRVVIAFDGDVARKEPVQNALHNLAAYLAHKGAKVEYLWLPDTPDKTGLDDYLAKHTAEELWRLVKPTQPPVAKPAPTSEPKAEQAEQPAPAAPKHPPMSLAQAHKVFQKWLGESYDTDALDVTLAAAAAEQLDGDPLWLMLVSGAGFAKTETAQALAGAGAMVTSTIQSEGALLSATSRKDRATDATGGLLRKIGDRGVLVVKDVTSVLSMNRDDRAKVLAALREVYDGFWERNVGTDGGRSLPWRGRIAVIGACTTAWDKAHTVIAAMGDRFVLYRMDSGKHRMDAGRQAMRNVGSEEVMRAELAAAAGGVLAGIDTAATILTDAEADILLAAADLVTMARTAVEFDYSGNAEYAHAPEAPTRFAKQLCQVVRGAVAIGIDRDKAMRLAIRCARDSMPPMRLAIIDDLAAHPNSTTAQVRRRIDQPRNTVDRQLQALHLLDVLTLDDGLPSSAGMDAEELGVRPRWRYSLSEDINPDALKPDLCPEMLYCECKGEKGGCEGVCDSDAPETPSTHPLRGGTAVSGQNESASTATAAPHCWCGEELIGDKSVQAGVCLEHRLFPRGEQAS